MLKKPSLTGNVVKDAVWSANDGIITTFAVVAGATGASLPSSIVLILGFANLLADAFSMAISNYLGTKSEDDYENKKTSNYSLGTNLMVTFCSFVIAGFFPLLPFLIWTKISFSMSLVSTAISLFIVGIGRGFITKKHPIASGLEMLLVGGVAAIIAFSVGYFVRSVVLVDF